MTFYHYRAFNENLWAIRVYVCVGLCASRKLLFVWSYLRVMQFPFAMTKLALCKMRPQVLDVCHLVVFVSMAKIKREMKKDEYAWKRDEDFGKKLLNLPLSSNIPIHIRNASVRNCIVWCIRIYEFETFMLCPIETWSQPFSCIFPQHLEILI